MKSKKVWYGYHRIAQILAQKLFGNDVFAIKILGINGIDDSYDQELVNECKRKYPTDSANKLCCFIYTSKHRVYAEASLDD